MGSSEEEGGSRRWMVGTRWLGKVRKVVPLSEMGCVEGDGGGLKVQQRRWRLGLFQQRWWQEAFAMGRDNVVSVSSMRMGHVGFEGRRKIE
ncbi:L,D-transpeptidase [Sesbania bispinosa]|nr:L,D-transpeptidase [Sesbania bispinosa]